MRSFLCPPVFAYSHRNPFIPSRGGIAFFSLKSYRPDFCRAKNMESGERIEGFYVYKMPKSRGFLPQIYSVKCWLFIRIPRTDAPSLLQKNSVTRDCTHHGYDPSAEVSFAPTFNPCPSEIRSRGKPKVVRLHQRVSASRELMGREPANVLRGNKSVLQFLPICDEIQRIFVFTSVENSEGSCVPEDG
jgi:hypothetical protein